MGVCAAVMWMRTGFSYIVLGGILIGAFGVASADQPGAGAQVGQRKEKAPAVMVDKVDHGRNGTTGNRNGRPARGQR